MFKITQKKLLTKTIFLISVLLFSVNARAQYTKLLDFLDFTNGSKPYGSLISDGTYLYGVTTSGGTSDLGTIFKIMPDGSSYVKLMDFSGTGNGSRPGGSLIYDGTFLYGMTSEGGAYNKGTLFKILTNGTGYTKLLDFSGIAEGSNPNGSLVYDGTFLYGMTYLGGNYDMGVVFKIMTNGTGFAKLLEFDGSNGSYPNGDLILNASFLYGMTQTGGSTYPNGIVFKIMTNGTSYFEILNFDGAAKGRYPNGSLKFDGTYLYGMTPQGGTSELGVIFKIMPDGTGYSKLLDFNGTNGSYPFGSLVYDGTFLYGMTNSGGIANGVLFKIMTNGTGYNKLLDFNGPNGQFPNGDLLLSGGLLYGMTSQGGSIDSGTVFRYNPNCVFPTVTPSANTTICKGNSTTIGASPSGGTPPYTYSWYPPFPLNCPTCSTPTATPNKTETFTVTVTDNLGCVNQATTNVGVYDVPVFNPGQTTLNWAGNVIDDGSSGGTYNWNPPGGAIGSTDGNYASTSSMSPGSYSHYLKATNFGISLPPGATVTGVKMQVEWFANNPAIDSVIRLVVGGSIQGMNKAKRMPINIGSDEIKSYGDSIDTWGLSLTKADVENGTGFGVVIGVKAQGATVGVGIDRINMTVFYTVPPNIAGPSTVCMGSTNVYSTGAGIGATSYTWTVPGDATINSGQGTQTVNVTFGAASGSVTVTGNNSCGPSTMGTFPITLNAPPTPTISASPSLTICTGDVVTLTAFGGVGYVWNPGGATTSTIIISPTSTNGYTVTAYGNGCSGVTSENITVNPIPIPAVSTPTTICNGYSVTISSSPSGGTPPYAYNWYPQFPLSCSSCANPTANPSHTENFTVTVTDNNGCSNKETTTVTVNDVPVFGPGSVGAWTNSVVIDNSIGSYSWNTPGNATGAVNDDNYAWSPMTSGATSNYLKATNFGISGIPPSAIIKGVKMQVEWKADLANTAEDFSVRLVKGGTIQGPDLARHTPIPTSDFMQIYGDSMDTWGTTLTKADVEDPNFGVVIASRIFGASGTTVSVDRINVMVFYSLPPNISGLSTVCAGSSQTYTTGTGIGVSTYSWTVPAGANITSGGTTNTIAVDFTGSSSGNITVAGQNTCGLSAIGTFSVTVNPIPTPTITAAPSLVICSGGNVTLTASGGGGNYVWNPGGATTTSITTSPTSTNGYTVTATMNGCSGIATEVITVNPIPTPTITAAPSFTICEGSSTTLTASGGTSYVWNPGGATTISITTSPTTTTGYTLTATSIGCSGTTTQTVTVNPVPLAPFPGSNTPCEGQDLSLTASSTGTTYNWSGPNSSAVQNPIILSVTTADAGTYSVTATTNGCTSPEGITTVTINPTPPAPVTGSNSPVCGGTDLSLTASTVAGATYNWTGPNSFSSALQNPTITGVTTASSGTYSVTVTVNGCTGSAGTTAVTINQTPGQPLAGPPSPVCSGQTLSLTASPVGGGGTTYNWSGPNGFSSGLQNPSIPNVTTAAGGTYSVAATENGCTGIVGTIFVTINETPSAPVPGSNSPVCEGTNLSLTASSIGGATYNWSGPNSYMNALQNPTPFSVSVAAAGTYSVTAMVNGCTGPAGTVLVAVDPATSSFAGIDQTVCADNANVSLTGSSPTGGTWSGGAGTFAPNATTLNAIYTPSAGEITAGAVTLTLTSTNNGSCSAANDNVIITITPTPAANAGVDQTICLGQNATLVASGGVTYNWNTTETTISITVSPTVNTNYTVTVTDAGGCTASDNVMVTVNSIPVAAISPSSSTICNGQSTTLIASGGATYLWSTTETTASITVSPTANATYSVTATLNGCSSSPATSAVTVSPLPTANAGTDDTICNGSNLMLNGTGAGIYNWSPATGLSCTDCANPIADPTVTTSYTFTVSDGCGTASDDILITVRLPIPITVTTTPTTCGSLNGTATADVTGIILPYHILWNTGDTVLALSGRDAGIYRVNVTDGNGCFSFADALVTNSNGPVVTTNSVTDVTCHGSSTGAIDITVSLGTAPYTYFWSNGATTEDISNLSYGPYEVVVKDANATTCTATQSIFVNEPAPLSVVVSTANSSCGTADGSASVVVNGGTAPYNYLWTPSAAVTAAVTGLPAGVYKIDVSDARGCTLSDLAGVSDNTGPLVYTDSILAADCGSAGFVLISAQDSLAIQSYQWNTGSTTQNLTNASPGNYGLTITDTLGCKRALVVGVQPVLPQLKPICLVTVDTATGNNIVIWQKPISPFIAGFNIYRESSQNGIYQLSGYVPYASQSTFYDSVADPDNRWAKYRISMKDVCGKEGPLSPAHKTIHLCVQSTTPTKTFLIWDEYDGYPVSQYYIFRKDYDNGPWAVIDSVPSTVTAFCDSLFPATGDTIRYHIDVAHLGGCTATTKNPNPMGTTIKTSKSNSSERLSAPPVSVGEDSSDKWLQVYPNPNQGTFIVQSSVSKNRSLEIYNMLGALLYQAKLTGLKTEISIPDIANGVYQMRLVTENGTRDRKIVISK